MRCARQAAKVSVGLRARQILLYGSLRLPMSWTGNWRFQ